MGTIILLDLIHLNSPYFLILDFYPYYLFNINYNSYHHLDYIFMVSQESWFFLYFPEISKFCDPSILLFFSKTQGLSLTFLFIYLLMIILSISSKIKLYGEFLIFFKNFKNYEFLKFLDYFFWNLFYLMVYWVRKKTWIRLNFRSLELKKKKNPQYHQLQYIKFFYVKFMFDLFFSIFLRLWYFFMIFLFRLVIFFIYNFLKFFFFKLDIYLVYLYISFYFHLMMKKIIKIDLLFRVYSLINYFKIEFFTYYFNDRSFLGGFIYYIYNSLNNKIGSFYNSHNWDNIEFKNSNFLSKCYNKLRPLFINYNVNHWLFNYSLNLISIFLFSLIFFMILIFKIISSIYKFLNNLISYYKIIELKVSFYLDKKLVLIFIISFFLFFFLDYNLSLIFLLSYLLIIYFDFLLKIFINYMAKFNLFFYYLGFSSIYIIDFIKNIIYYFFFGLIHLFLKLKYIFIFIFFFKLGLFNILNLGLIALLSNYFEYPIFFILDKILYALIDFYNINNFYLFGSDFNNQLINIVSYDFSNASYQMRIYVRNSFLNRIYTLNFKSIDFSNLTWTSFKNYQLNAVRQISARKYYKDLFVQFIWECGTFIYICKNYYLFKFFKFYYIYLFRYSDINLYYYFIKKLYTLLYLAYIYLYLYLKWLYYYFVPFYILSKWLLFKFFIIYTWFYLFFSKIYFIFNSIFLWFLNYFFLNSFRFIYILSFLRIFIFNLIDLIYYIIYDTFYLSFSLKLLVNYYDGLVDWYWDYFINKTLFMENLKDLLINLFRISKNNIIDFSLNKSIILGGKLRGVSLLDVESLNMTKVKDSGMMVHQMDDFVIVSTPEIKHNRIFKYRDNLLVYSDIFTLLNIYGFGEYWEIFYLREQWIFNFFLRKFIMYYLIDFYFIYYLFFYLFFYYIFRDKDQFLNLDNMWKNLKDEFDYKLLNNNSLFIKALNFYQKNTGKKTLNNILFNKLNNNWKKINNKFFKNIKKFNKIKRDIIYSRSYLTLGKLKSFVFNNNSLRNIYLEKYLYYNNKYFFYWKDLIFFDKEKNFYIKYDKNNQFLYFFLSLIFKKNKYSSKIFFYFDTFNKMYFYNNNLPIYLKKTYAISRTYFERLDYYIFNNKGDAWLLHKDLSLILYKDESKESSDMYSLNFNIIIPFFEKIFFWVVLIAYLYFTKFHWRLTPQVDYFGRINRAIYIQSLIFNNNIFFLYDLSIYWINAFSLFDIKHFSYEYNDFVNEWMKMRKLMRHYRKCPSFLIYADPLFFHKKNAGYHLLWLDLKYYHIYTSYNIYLYYTIKKIFILIVIFLFYSKVVINRKSYLWPSMNENLNLIIYLWYFYNKNIININNYLKFYYKKILSNLEMNKLLKRK